MQDEGTKFQETILRQFLEGRVSRAQLFKASVAGLAIAAVPGATFAADTPTATGATTSTTTTGRAPFTEFPFFPQVPSGTYTTEAIKDIVNVASTAEALAVTVLTAAVNNATTLGLTGLVLNTVQAALVEELAHFQLLRDVLGAKPLTTTFYVPDPKILTDKVTFLSTLEVAENLFIAAYMTAAREFAELGQPTLAKVAYQTGSTEAEHRVMVRAALALNGDTTRIPPNNKAFETDLLLYVADAVGILKGLGFLGPSGTAASYPGDAAALTAAGPMVSKVVQKTPNNATTTVVVTSTAALTGERT
jgi:hypothetical protein